MVSEKAMRIRIEAMGIDMDKEFDIPGLCFFRQGRHDVKMF